MNKFNLSKKLVVYFLLLCLGSVLLIAIFSGYFTRKILTSNAESHLVSIGEIKKKQVEQYFMEKVKDVQSIASSEVLRKSLEDLIPLSASASYPGDSLRRDSTISVKPGQAFISYDSVVNIYDAYFKKIKQVYGVADLYLVSEIGDVVYSVEKDKDYRTNLVTGKYSGQNLARAFRSGKDAVTITDFEKLGSKNDEVFSFISSPVYNENNELLGVAVLQISPAEVNDIIKDASGLGQTGEALLVGADKLLRSDSRFEPGTTILTAKLDAPLVKQALQEEGAVKGVTDQRGVPVIASFSRIDIGGLKWGVITKMDTDEVFAPLASLRMYIIIFAAAVSIVLILIVLYITRSVTQPVKKLREYLLNLSKGELPDHIRLSSKDEFGEIEEVVNNLTDNLRNAADFAVNIGEGNFDSEFNVLSEKDKLGHSLTNMRDRLVAIAEEDKKRNWTTEGLARFGDILRSSNDDLTGLSSKIISNLVTYLNANQGGLFIVNSDSGSPYLELIAAYAYERKKYLTKRVDMGEGLVGQAWQEGDTILLTDVPENYVNITSGLGDSTPRSILIIPLKVNEEIFGVVEIASFSAFDKHEVEFVQKLGESIASTISTVRVNERTKKLLEDSQVQAEQLRAQEEEMRQNMEEMQATQEEMKRIQGEMEAQNNIINNIAIVSKTDLRGNITYVNEEFLKWSKYTREEVMGKNHRILKSGHQEDAIFTEMWKTISSGKIFRGEVKNRAKDGSYYWVDAIIAPVLDDNGKPKEYIAQRFVINDQKKKEEEMKQMMEESRAQEEEIRQNMEEMQATQEEMKRIQGEMEAQNEIINSVAIVSKTDLRGNITYVNEEFLKWSKYTREEVMGKNHRILKSGHQDDAIFVEMWKTISSGRIFRGEVKNRAKDGTYYWVDAIIAPVLDANGKPKEYLAQRFVINDQKKKEEEMKQMMEEARAQEEELRQNMEEMQATQEEMKRIQGEMEAQNDIINSVAIVSKTDLRGNITYVNEEFLKWSKYTREELLGKNHRILKSGHQDDAIFVEMWKTISSGRIFRGEVKNRAKDGSHYWVDAIIAPVLDDNGKPKEYIAQRFVINDQKKKEEEMRQLMEETRAQEEELRQNMEEMQATQEEMKRIQGEMEAQNEIINSVAIVSKTDLRGNITYVNEEFLKWSKYTREEVMGKNHRILKSGHQDDEIFVEMWKTISSGRVFRGEVKNRAKDGTYYWVDAIIAPVLDDNGKPKEYIAQRFVINEKKEKEEAMQKLMEEARIKEEELLRQLNELKKK